MKAKIIPILLITVISSLCFCISKPVNGAQFPDVVKGSWYEDAVVSLVNKGVVHGFPDGTFKPEQNIKYDEFIKLLVTAMGYTTKSLSGHWAAQYIEEAKRMGYVYGNEVSDYTRNINRGEMARLLSRAFGYTDPMLFSVYQMNMADYDEIDAKFRDHALICYMTGLINGIDGSFEPYLEVTRKEACVIIHRLIKPDIRVVNKPAGTIDGFVSAKELSEDIKKLGYQIDGIFDDTVLTKQSAYQIIFDAISNDSKSRQRFIPVSVEHIGPVIFTEDDFHMSEVFSRVIETTRSISQNMASMQLFEIRKKYEDGSIKSMLSYNVFDDNKAISMADKSIEGFRELSGKSHRMPHDHTRFEKIFTDSEMIDQDHKEALYKLYDYGLVDDYSLSGYSYSFYCSPQTYITKSEIAVILKKLNGEIPLNVLDEKSFGTGDSWGVEKFGSANYSMRLSEMITVYIYDIIDSLGGEMMIITPGDKGYIVYMATLEYPYYDDFFLISDDCPDGEYNNTESTSIQLFLEYDIHKYKNLVPAGYSKMIEADIREFLDDENAAVFFKNYGGMEFEMTKTGADRVRFRYAFREG